MKLLASILILAVSAAPTAALAERAAVRTVESQRIDERLADGTLDPVVRDIHWDHDVYHKQIPGRFDENSYKANMHELHSVSDQAKCERGERRYCPSTPAPKLTK